MVMLMAASLIKHLSTRRNTNTNFCLPLPTPSILEGRKEERKKERKEGRQHIKEGSTPRKSGRISRKAGREQGREEGRTHSKEGSMYQRREGRKEEYQGRKRESTLCSYRLVVGLRK
jgi:hypothetical protein